MKASVICACNSDEVLRSCLQASPEVHSDAEIFIVRGGNSASDAYNQGILNTGEEIMIFAHQDVFLPAGWRVSFELAIRALQKVDPNWGVVGVFGVDLGGNHRGWIYSSGLRSVLGGPFGGPQQVRTLDEVLLVIRRSSGLHFDKTLDGFHMYGTDICLEAEKRGLRNYVVPCFAIHNSNGIKNLPMAFWKACLHVRRKWRDRLPIHSPCVSITRFPLGPAKLMLWRFARYTLRGQTNGTRVPDPVVLHQQLQSEGTIPKPGEAVCS